MEKNNYLEEVLNLNNFVNIIKMVENANDINRMNVNNIQFEDKDYIIYKDKNNIFIKSSDGRKLEYKIDIKEVDYGQEKRYYHDVKIIMSLLNGGILLLNKSISSKNMNAINISNYNILEDCNIIYISNNYDYHHLIWNEKENQFNYKYGMTHEDNEYVYFDGKDRYVISRDLNEIKGISKKSLPSKEEIYSFNKEEEKQKLNNILNNSQLNEVTKNIVLEIMNDLDNKEKIVNKIKNAYQETVIPKCIEILKEEINLNKSILNSIFSSDELIFILNYLDNKIIKSKSLYKK